MYNSRRPTYMDRIRIHYYAVFFGRHFTPNSDSVSLSPGEEMGTGETTTTNKQMRGNMCWTSTPSSYLFYSTASWVTLCHRQAFWLLSFLELKLTLSTVYQTREYYSL